VVKALDEVSLQVYEGEILGILGPNGAGKTTLLNTLSTLLIPDSGSIEMMGIQSHPKNFRQLRTLFNMSSGYPNFPWSLTIEENLRF
jgi:ABC-2 type transport system ATP-binding protein